ncbi:2OG-Fe dioxygenase family protein [Catenovulum sp. 2E275]|uniref:2OG-Fe dioxygenase family protein n=1 Tax=Catenovulum sp. 2E275 TaxID=2980497 RepID=UPI0021CFAEC3|nr:2OG-Fe dioxygenase family protein [Catenovulum sp. 2E275]MCU4677550.1 2OG-Fe dioxygenase family protein [Catenovulum sp. 2E275]
MDMSIYQRISSIKLQYLKNRCVFIPSDEMISILKGMGSTDADLAILKDAGDKLVQDPTLDFRKSRNGRYCYDPANKNLYRTEFQPFILSKEEDFVRHDSNTVRKFRGLSECLQNNTAFQNLLIFKHLICHDIHIKQRPGSY